MFEGCVSLQKINLGNIDFCFSKSFKRNLKNIDVSNFNTKNSTAFEMMFCGCKKVEKIDVSKFDSSKCTSIFSMFKNCENISQIDMINWDMGQLENIYPYNHYCSYIQENLQEGLDFRKALKFGRRILKSFHKTNSINYLFDGCKKLKTIKMSSNFGDIDNLIFKNENNEVFKGIPKYGNFYWKKGINCDKLLNQLPAGWNRYTI